MRRCGALAAVAAVALQAEAQTFVAYDVDAENLTTGQQGHALNASPGDIIRVAVRPVHDGFSFAGGSIDILLEGVLTPDVGTLEEDGTLQPFDPWNVGRTPLTRSGEAPDGVGGVIHAQPDPGLYGVDTVISDDQLTAIDTGWFDSGTTPPGLGGLVGAFPIASGDRLFVFDFEYRGGRDVVSVATADEAFVYESGGSVSALAVPARFGTGLTIVPAPAGGAALGLGGALAFARRRRSQS